MGRAEKNIPEISNHDKIKNRIMELFETTDDLKIFFKSILPSNSLLKEILKIDEKENKEEVCEIILSYLGDNFFVYVGKVRSDEEVEFEGETVTKSMYKKMKNNLENINSLTPEEINRSTLAVEKYEALAKINPVHTVREKLLEQICIFWKDQSDNKRKEIIDDFNYGQKKDKHKVKTLEELSKSKKFLVGSWAKKLCDKTLRLPDIIIEKPEKEPPLPETNLLEKKKPLPRLYDFQTEALIEIHNLFNNSKEHEWRQKRLLVNVPTGAGKTRMTVQAIIEWLNLYREGRCENAHEQQKNPHGLIFWFASTNELCSQASESFQEIFSHIGTADQINLTNWFGSNRRSLKKIRDEKPGIHIVITNTHHTNKNFKHYENKEVGTYRYDHFRDSLELDELRKNTIAVVIDEAHEVTSDGYRDFLAAMGFDQSPNKRGHDKKIYNTQNIVLIGLTATAYKGSGITDWSDKHDEDFADDDVFPAYIKKLDPQSKRIHRTFGGVFLPIPHKIISDSPPVVIIDVPLTGQIGDSLKISGINSYDQYSNLTYFWEISTFEKIIYSTDPELESDLPEFYHKFTKDGDYSITLTVSNAKEISRRTEQKIRILPKENSRIKRTGDLSDTKEFYDILTNDQNILCTITHGVVDGPQSNLSKSDLKKWRMGTLDNEDGNVSTDVEYNTHLCEIVDKCIRVHGKKRILIFANGVRHSQELMMILRVNYKHKKTESVDGTTNPGIRRRIVKEFREGNIKILCNFGVLTTGFDVPKIDTVIIARDVGSNALYTQMIGRGQRGPKSGGTDNLWLITSNFPHTTDNNENLELGWEALAKNWQKFPSEIKNELGLNLGDLKIKNTPNTPKLEVKKTDFILNIEPIQDLKLKCQSCGIITQGLENNLDSYGYKSEFVHDKKFQEQVKNSLEQNKFSNNCKFCRKIISILGESKCEFTKYIAANHELDPIFVLILHYIHKYQTKNKFIINWKIFKNDLKNKIPEKGIPNDYFTHTMPAINKLTKNKIIKIKNNLDIEFIKIDDLDTFKKIITHLENNINLKNRFQIICNRYKINNNLNENKFPNELDSTYYKLKNELEHIPTKRQFTIRLEQKSKTQFKESYNNDYRKFLSHKREFFKDDENLKDLLYQEYFEKCIREKSKITHKQLDEVGDYRLDDYKDMWTTVEKFETKVEPIINDVLKNYDELHENRNSEFEAISKDIQELKQKRPADYYHFEAIRNHANIRVFRYLIQLKISHLRYLKNYTGKNHGVFLQLVSDFFRLQNWIQTTPTRDEFMKLTVPLATSNLMKEFGITNSDYEKFLEMISIDISDSPNSEHKEIMRDIVIEELKKYCNEHDKDKTLQLIDLPLDQNDKLSVQIEMYFSNKKDLKKLLFPVNSNTEP
jgi:superfamily II DNA or RNA helicase